MDQVIFAVAMLYLTPWIIALAFVALFWCVFKICMTKAPTAKEARAAAAAAAPVSSSSEYVPPAVGAFYSLEGNKNK